MFGTAAGTQRSGEYKSVSRPGKRLAVMAFIVALSFCAVCGKVLLDARRAAWERAGEVAAGFVATMESDIARNIDSYDLSLGAVIESLKYPEIIDVSPELRQHILFDRSATAKHLHAITYLDENGIVRLDSRTPFPKPIDRLDTDFFQFQKTNRSGSLFISKPFVTKNTKTLVISVARRVANPDGSFAGVVAGTIRLAYFSELFKRATLGPNDHITLSRTDGTVLMRWPNVDGLIGQNLGHAELFKRLERSRSGRFETHAATDGVHRLVVYRQVGDLPLVIAVGQSTADIYAPWRRYATTIGAMMVLLCALSITFALYLAREMKRRNRAEARLELLAATDGLTGLSNRRSFNEAIDREWRRAARDKQALALIMIDTDHFKSYNDRNGHQAGDRLLQAIGVAMGRSIRRGADLAARFGGDEFAILMPGGSAAGAAHVAEQLRANLEGLCKAWSIPSSGLSMGVASLEPAPHKTVDDLIAAADEALYRAKERGRGRIEAAAVKPVLVASAA